jgi:hypothetical protein
MNNMEATEQFRNELKSCYKRWFEESDLEEPEMLEVTGEVLEELFPDSIEHDDEHIQFEPDFEINDIEEDYEP